jgi:uncharacterized protein (TIGR01777 family)
MKKILVGGGSGVLGSHLCDYLLSQNYDVFVLSRTPKKVRKHKAVYWNPESKELDKSSLPDAEGVINLSGAGIADRKWTKSRKMELRRSRILSNELLASTMGDSLASAKVFIGASAIGYYGDRGEEKLTEVSEAGANGFLVDLCKEWEDSIELIRMTGIRTIALRMGVVLTEKGGMLKRMAFPRRFGLAPYFGNGSQYFSWVHIHDLCGIFHFLLKDENMKSVYNAVSPNPVTFKSFSKAYTESSKGFAVAFGIPSWMIRLIFGEMSTAILMGSRVLPVRLLEQGFSFRYDSIEKAVAGL